MDIRPRCAGLLVFSGYRNIRTPAKERITLRHLLAMSDGLHWFESVPPHDSWRHMCEATDPYRYVLGHDVSMSPGRAFNYNSGATELLAEVLRRCTGKTVDVLAQEELFQPLGISDVEWNRHFRNGNPQAAGALRARPRDFAKIVERLVYDVRSTCSSCMVLAGCSTRPLVRLWVINAWQRRIAPP
jgi:CubicO group peptidase (beta-lactamase class C family)